MADPHHATDAADADAHAYVRGGMEINEQVSTWKLVQTLFSWGSLSLAVLMLFLVVWFMPNGSFFAGLISGVVVFAAGFFFLKSGSKSH